MKGMRLGGVKKNRAVSQEAASERASEREAEKPAQGSGRHENTDSFVDGTWRFPENSAGMDLKKNNV